MLEFSYIEYGLLKWLVYYINPFSPELQVYFLSLIIIIIIITIISEHLVVSVVIICQFSKLLFASKGMLSMF